MVQWQPFVPHSAGRSCALRRGPRSCIDGGKHIITCRSVSAIAAAVVIGRATAALVVEPQRSKMRRHTSSPTDVTQPLLQDDEAKPKEAPSKHLAPAPPAVCYLIAVAYIYLCDQGIEHCRRLQKTGRTDVGELMIEWCILLVVYSIETLLAYNGMTTLYRWNKQNYVEHHLPLVLGSVLWVLLGVDPAIHQEWAALTLAISFIEASAALLVHHPSKRWHAFRLGLNSIVQLDLLCADLWSYWRHVSSDDWTWPSLLLTQGLLAAAATHVYYGQGIVRAISRRGRQERELAGLGALVMLGVGLWISPW